MRLLALSAAVRHKPRIGNSSRPTLPVTSRGILLIECLIYIGTFTVIMLVAMQMFYQSRENSDRLRRHSDSITRALHAGEVWREEIRSAAASPHIVSHPSQTWLAIPQATNVVLYTHFKDAIWKQSHEGARWILVLAGVTGSRMESDARKHVIAWRWDLELVIKGKRKKTRPTFTFLSVPSSGQQEKQL